MDRQATEILRRIKLWYDLTSPCQNGRTCDDQEAIELTLKRFWADWQSDIDGDLLASGLVGEEFIS